MPDDTTQVGAQDRSRVAGEQEHEVRYFAEKHGISIEQARELIERHGNDRETLDAAAAKLGGR
jgi:hypothetical protein